MKARINLSWSEAVVLGSFSHQPNIMRSELKSSKASQVCEAGDSPNGVTVAKNEEKTSHFMYLFFVISINLKV